MFYNETLDLSSLWLKLFDSTRIFAVFDSFLRIRFDRTEYRVLTNYIFFDLVWEKDL